jgi:hypothetical protein
MWGCGRRKLTPLLTYNHLCFIVCLAKIKPLSTTLYL